MSTDTGATTGSAPGRVSPAAPVVELRGVSKTFGPHVAVDHVTLDVAPHTLKSIIGPNGAGKTTFFNLLSGQYRPSEGRILFRGRDITSRGAAARTRLGATAVIGVSCYDSLDRARQLAAAGADYLAFGAYFPSPTKPLARHARTDLLRDARALGLPLVAIGGITPDNAQPLIEAGADFVAAISGVFATADPRAAARRYANLFTK